MFKLTIVAGPNRGTTFAVRTGENQIGRQQGNDVVLPSSKVSKRHCVLVVNNADVIVKDRGSANGTFVNGVMTKMRKVRVGDRISVGEYVLELIDPPRPAASMPNVPAISGIELDNNIIPFPGVSVPSSPAGGIEGFSNELPVAAANQPPKDLIGKLKWNFEHQLMPTFYGLNLQYEWRAIASAVFAAFVLVAVAISVYPLLKSSRAVAVREVSKRAIFMARQIAERNAPALRARAETKTEIDRSLERAEGVQTALLIGMDSRIIAPMDKYNSYLTTGPEAILAVKARKAFEQGRETGMVAEMGESLVVAVEPVKIAAEPKNVIIAMAVVSIDASFATSDYNDMGLIFSETVIITALIGALFLLVLYRMSLKPYEVLGDDMDKVLKGEMTEVTQQFKLSETKPLWDLINSALQRAARNSSGGGGDSVGADGAGVDDYLAMVRAVGSFSPVAMLACDANKRIAYMNEKYEELSGLRFDGVNGQELPSVARDESQASFLNDILDRAMAMPGQAISEDYEFSGNSYKVHAVAFGPLGGAPRALLLAATRNEG